MSGNDLVDSYLKVTLDVGKGIDADRSSLLLRERGRFSPARYFVEEVITGFDETDLYKTWVRVSSSSLFSQTFGDFSVIFWRFFVGYLAMIFGGGGGGNAGSAGLEHKAREHVLEDLELNEEEEADHME